MALQHKHYLYCLMEREFRKTGEAVLTVGRTGAGLIKRMSQYPNGSLMVCAIPVSAASLEAVEASVLACARIAFRQRLDIGREYFEADVCAMVQLMYSVAGAHVPVGFDDGAMEKVDDPAWELEVTKLVEERANA